ncbi:hypothetical protein I6A84_14495 [Frankia sp. CNm7]|uniref:Uncharacterized protein n=1 Tax=Frankia nepalensis TaxID=1836974 RepID=A0A937RNY5_9ACTN|nr:hypothetical protein [Frankia nepalensis]MBL7498081.1 hypothetical protein [Frankia nepalensis]MBL7509303.1 hypothetical protein [Frankia nepalensis]MBL7519280.1 hypothetical protein [Frankia nepalensis]MBL7632269.1 hypothetical protein [Frankia nepalensis]
MTVPDPVRVSPASGEPEKAEIIIVGTRRSSLPLECARISVRIPDGERSPEFALNLQGVTASISIDGWTPTFDSQTGRFIFAPPTGHGTISVNEGITIQFRGIPVNRQVGSAPITIIERSRPQGESTWNEPQTVIEVGKFPRDFYLRNLTVTPIEVDNGGSVTLRWEASQNANYRLLYGATDIDVTDRREFTVNNLTSTTTFYLRGRAQVGEDHAERILHTTVTVTRPHVDATDLSATGKVAMAGKTTTIVGPANGSRYAVPTDGILVLMAEKNSQSAPESFFLVSGEGVHFRVLAIDDLENTGSVLLRAGTTISVILGAEHGDSVWNPSHHRHYMKWTPFGSGDLQPL